MTGDQLVSRLLLRKPSILDASLRILEHVRSPRLSGFIKAKSDYDHARDAAARRRAAGRLAAYLHTVIELVGVLEAETSVRHLVAMLRETKSDYDNAADVHEMRHAALKQVVGLMHFAYDFLDRIVPSEHEDGPPNPLRYHSATVPTVDLLLALMSLDLGRRESILQPLKKTQNGRPQGGRPRSANSTMLRAYAVAASEALASGDVPISIADNAIARSLMQLGCQNADLRAEKLTGRTIAGWRKEVSEARATDPVRQLYDAITSEPSESMRVLVPRLNAYEWVPPMPHHESRFPITKGILNCWALMDELRVSLPRSWTNRVVLERLAPMWVGSAIRKTP